ncbi:MAG: hypothetical protein Q8876_07960 [Bacillota bacterium]|nr:hypothetical protein [Bacillota bacterium]
MKQCAKCNFQNNDESIYCQKCGRLLSYQKSAVAVQQISEQPEKSMYQKIIGIIVLIAFLAVYFSTVFYFSPK